jgi:hypothetical protein
MINGGMSKSLKPARDLKQRDPLYPYLFILCQEILSRMIEKEHLDGGIFVYKLNIGGPTLTHVMYVDDILLFSKATRYEASSLNDCLDKHCGWSRANGVVVAGGGKKLEIIKKCRNCRGGCCLHPKSSRMASMLAYVRVNMCNHGMPSLPWVARQWHGLQRPCQGMPWAV